MVWVRNEKTLEYGYRPVIATKRTENQPIFKVEVANGQGATEILETTVEHPFWVKGFGWLKASLLQSGMKLVDRHNQELTVVSQYSESGHLDTVYNIEVDEHHTYHVGEFGTWVHNANCIENKPTISVVVKKKTPDVPKTPIGVPEPKNPVHSPVLEYDKHGNEIMYRTMSEKHFKILSDEGYLSATGETFLSPSKNYSSDYGGVMVQFTLEKGTIGRLWEIGLTGNGGTRKIYPDLPPSQKQWGKEHAQFKIEAKDKKPYVNNGQGVINTGLGQGRALDIFNDAILNFKQVEKTKNPKQAD